MQIVIPTHGRPYKQTTLQSLPEAIRDDVLLVVSTQEDFDVLKKTHKNIRRADVKTIADKRHWIMQNVKTEKIFMLDDDMYFFGRCPAKYRTYEERWRVTTPPHKILSRDYANDAALLSVFSEIDRQLDNYAHVGLSSRMGNDVEEKEWKENSRMMHAIGLHRNVYTKQKLLFNEVQCREDFNVTLRLLRRGYANTVCYSYCCSPGPYGAKGGASTERTVEISNAQALKLSELHPGLVRVVDKEYDNVPRKEVVVSWKKAYCYDL